MKFVFGPITADVVQLRSPDTEFNMAIVLSDASGAVYYAVEKPYEHSREILAELPKSMLMRSVASEAVAELDMFMQNPADGVKGMVYDGIPDARAQFAGYQARKFIHRTA